MMSFAPNRLPGWVVNRWQLSAIVIWLVIVVASCVRVLFFAHASPGTYPTFAEAGRNWLAGANLYPDHDDFHVYRYSPAVTPLFAMLSSVPDNVGNALWRILNAAVYAWGLLRWTRSALPRPLTPTQQALIFLLVVPLSTSSLVNAQSNALLTGALLLTMAAAVEERWNWAGACVTIAIMLKVYPIAIALLLMVLYPRHFTPRFLIAFALGLLLPFCFQRPEYVATQYSGWLHLLGQDSDRAHWRLEFWYRDLRLLARVWATPISLMFYHVLQLGFGAAIGLIGLAGYYCRLPRRQLLTTLLGLSCCWMTVLGPATEANTYILLAPSLAWAVVEAWVEKRSAAYRVVLGGSFALFTVAQVAIWFPGVREFHSMGPHPFAGMLLFGCLLTDAIQKTHAAYRLQSRVPEEAQPQAAPRAA